MVDVAIMLRLDATKDRFPGQALAELDNFMAWMESIGVNPGAVRALAIEAPAMDGPDLHYLLHLTEYQAGPNRQIIKDPATGEPKLTYRAIRLDEWSWPPIRAVRTVDTMVIG